MGDENGYGNVFMLLFVFKQQVVISFSADFYRWAHSFKVPTSFARNFQKK
jgi:hypothetical protein